MSESDSTNDECESREKDTKSNQSNIIKGDLHFGINKRFRLINKLGSGSFGQIFLCYDRECNKQ
ncbi:MAG: hypothetical protein MHPSP_004054, partial [Paramarteilia canceri]